jgi:Ca-activated chloride channel family protein
MLSEFHFLRPAWLLSFVPLIFFLLWFARRRFEMRRWRNIVDPALMPHVLIGSGYQTRRRVTVVLALAGTLLITALAGPVWQRLPQPVFRSQDALVIALDLSRSMDVADVNPSRLVRARFKISDILKRRNEGQTALIAYAAQPYVISPLTDDTQTIIAQLPALTTSLMPSQGSRADLALAKAAELLKQSGVSQGHLLLVTDGVDSARTAPIAQELAKKGMRISVLGIGTNHGGPIPGQGGFVKHRNGSIVIAKLDTANLKRLAKQGHGFFRPLSTDDSDIDHLLASVSQQPEESAAVEREADTWREQGPWLLLLLLPLAALAFRRGVLAVWLLLFMLPYKPAAALDWNDLWSRPDQQASRQLAAGDAEAAARLFTDPAWKGAAAYQAGNYADSLTALDGLDNTDATYNRGNALARLGRYDEAITAYEDVLAKNPENSDARYNRDLLREQQKQQQQQNEDGQSQSERDSADDSSADSQQQAESGQKSDQQNGQQNQDDSTAAQASADEPPGEDATNQQPDDASMTPDSAPPDEAQPTAESGDESADENAAQPTPAAATQPENRDEMPDEEAQAAEQWLRKIPDDPGGLLRRKFYYQYQQQGAGQQEDEPW